MKLLYNTVHDKKHRSICLEGPPGIGKTTALYWLFKQLKHEHVTCRPISMGSLASADEAADVLLISPSLLDTSQLMVHTFVGIMKREKLKDREEIGG
jgi:DNA polymerase III delta prime subunit